MWSGESQKEGKASVRAVDGALALAVNPKSADDLLCVLCKVLLSLGLGLTIANESSGFRSLEMLPTECPCLKTFAVGDIHEDLSRC